MKSVPIFVFLCALLLGFGAPAIGEAQTGYWQSVKTDSYIAPYAPDTAYPDTYVGGEGNLTVTVSEPSLNPAPALGATFLWSRPPSILIPGTALYWPVTAVVTKNVPGRYLGLSFTAEMYPYQPVSNLPTVSPWASVTYATAATDFSMPVGTSINYNNALQKTPALIPSGNSAWVDSNGYMTILMWIRSSSTFFWSYVYQWVPTQLGSCGGSCTLAAAGQNMTAAGGPGSVGLTASSTWDVVPIDSWIKVTSLTSGSGSTTVTFTVNPNYGPPRSGTILIGGKPYTIYQDGSSGGGPPAPVSVSPAAGTAAAQPYTFTFSDPDGWQDLDVVNILINNFLDGRAACYLAYSRPYNVLYLVNDAGSALLPGLVLNGSGSTSNSTCTVTGAGSSASGNGTTLALTLNMSFGSTYTGNKVIYMAARDLEGGNSGWQALGTCNVPASGTQPAVSVGGVTPSRSSGSGSQQFVFTISDSNGWQDLGVMNVLINDFLNGNQACYLAYSRAYNVLYLVNDAGNALLPGLLLNGSGSVGNSQCTVSGVGSSASGSGNTLSLTLNMGFSASFAGNRLIYMAARSNGDVLNSGWQAVGSRTVAARATMPQISVSPASLDFGSVMVGQSSNKTVTISNTGVLALTVSGLNANAPYSVVSPATPLTVPAGGTVVTVKFSPTSVTSYSSSYNLTITSNDPMNSSLAVPLTGAGTSAGGVPSRPSGWGVDSGNALSTGLVGLFAMNEGSGSTDKNLLNGQTAAFAGASQPTWNAADPSIVFKGGASTNSYLNAGPDLIFNQLTTSRMTVLAKVYVNTLAAAGICEKNDGNGADGFVWGWDLTGALRLTVEKSGTDVRVATDAGAIAAGRWVQVAMTWDGTVGTAAAAHLFLNGVEQSKLAASDGSGTLGFVNATNQPFRIGNASFDSIAGSLNGKMAYLAVYKGRILTPAEMIQFDAQPPLSAAGTPLPQPPSRPATAMLDSGSSLAGSLAGLFLMNEGAGASDKNLVTGQTAVFSGTVAPGWNTTDPSVVFMGGGSGRSFLDAGAVSVFDQLPVSKMTIVAKVWVNLMTPAGLCEKDDGNVSDGFEFGWDWTGALLFTMEKSAVDLRVASAAGAVPAGWAQIAVTWDGTVGTAAAAHLFVNGVEQVKASASDGSGQLGYANATNQPFRIGNASFDPMAGSLNGKIAYLAVYKGRILSAAEMNQLDAHLPIK